MRAFCILLLFCAASACVGAAFGQTARVPFSITISTDKPVVEAGSRVYIRVKITNTSDQPVDCTSAYTNGLDRGLDYDVRNEDGVSLLKPDIHPEHYPMSLQDCSLEAGKSKEIESRLNWLYDLSSPGKYSVSVSRRISDDGKSGMVKSNTITITIVATGTGGEAPK